jgi:hypothetical protein
MCKTPETENEQRHGTLRSNKTAAIVLWKSRKMMGEASNPCHHHVRTCQNMDSVQARAREPQERAPAVAIGRYKGAARLARCSTHIKG